MQHSIFFSTFSMLWLNKIIIKIADHLSFQQSLWECNPSKMFFMLSNPQMVLFFQVESSSKFLGQRHLSSHILILPVKSLDHTILIGMVSFVANIHSQMMYSILCQASLTGVCTCQKCTSPMVFSVSGKSPWVVSLARWENGQMLFWMSNKSQQTCLDGVLYVRHILPDRVLPKKAHQMVYFVFHAASLSLDSLLDFKHYLIVYFCCQERTEPLHQYVSCQTNLTTDFKQTSYVDVTDVKKH